MGLSGAGATPSIDLALESVSKLDQALQNFRSMRQMDASFKNAMASRLRFPNPWRDGDNG
jgi:hypothetical protein